METFIFNDKYFTYTWFKDFHKDMLPDAEEYRKSGYINLHCAFDIETTRVNEKFSTMYVWQFAVNKLTVMGRTWVEFINFIEILGTHYSLVENNIKLRVWIQNLSYEWSFVRKWLKYRYDKKHNKLDIFATAERSVIKFCTDNNIEFRDSLILTCRPLKDYAKVYGLENGKIPDGLNYSICRTSDTILTNEEIAYCIQDVQTLREWDYKYITKEFLKNDKKIPLTSTGIPRAELKANFKNLDKNYKLKYRDMIKQSFPSEKLYKTMIEWLYRGGYVHANASYSNYYMELDNMGSFDKKSSYPASALQEEMPYRFVKKSVEVFYRNVWNKDNKPCYNYKLWKKQAFIATLRFKNIIRTTDHAIESKNKIVTHDGAYWDNGRLSKANEIVVVLNEIDFLNYIDFYRWESVECIDLLYADKAPLPEFVKDMFLKYFYLKETIEDKNSTEYFLSKALLNALYGMMVTGLFNGEIFMDDNGNLKKADNENEWEELTRNQILLPQWGIWITAYSRRSELLLFSRCTDVMYGDTDSGKMGNIWQNMQWIDCYNTSLRRKNKNMYTGIYPKEIYTELGTFQFEEKYYKFKCLRAKSYMGSYIAKDKKTGKYYMKTTVTVAGLPKGSLENYAKEQGKNTYELFDFGLCIDKEHSMKMGSHYEDAENWEDVIDYQGHTTVCFEKSCVSLNDIPFEIKKDYNYLQLIALAKHKERNERRYGRN